MSHTESAESSENFKQFLLTLLTLREIPARNDPELISATWYDEHTHARTGAAVRGVGAWVAVSRGLSAARDRFEVAWRMAAGGAGSLPCGGFMQRKHHTETNDEHRRECRR
jgi:hypothetical protein